MTPEEEAVHSLIDEAFSASKESRQAVKERAQVEERLQKAKTAENWKALETAEESHSRAEAKRLAAWATARKAWEDLQQRTQA